MHVHATKKKTKRQQTSKRDNIETKEAPKGEKKKKEGKRTKGQTNIESTQKGKQACYQTNKQERVSWKDECRFGFGVRSSIMLEYGQHMCH